MNKVNEVTTKLINYVFPNRCAFCYELCDKDICDNCQDINNASARISGQAVSKKNCELSFVRNAYAAYEYNDDISKLIHKLKYGSDLYLARFCANSMYANLVDANKLSDYDVVISVPKKGFDVIKRDNISAIIAKFLCSKLNIKLCNNALKKIRTTKHQASLDGKERRENVIDAFDVKNKPAIENKRVLLVDDILTTGSTVNECAKAVMNSCAIYCDVICFATSQKYL